MVEVAASLGEDGFPCCCRFGARDAGETVVVVECVCVGVECW